MTTAVETGPWQLDPTASTVVVRHRTMWGLVTVKVRFGTVAGRGEVLADGTATGTVTVAADSLDSRNGGRDKHLRSADFLDTGTHPEIVLTVRGAGPLAADGTVPVSGELTVRGVAQPQDLVARVTGAEDGAVTLETEFTVDRERFGMTWNQLGMVRGPATVVATLRFTRTEA
ncbi:YceI family protein [Streptomyces sp. NPDC047000]|uniref:YceI family protein n=1 Tax=Streptomyces sp. NPDC047000 TaxID=3155474 RepID=UPI0033F728E0